MKFREWLLSEAKAEDILQHVYQSVSNLLNGTWIILERKKYAITYHYQMKEHIDIGGTNIKKFGDRFRIRCFVVVAKREGEIEPYPGYYQGGWSYNKDVEWLKPYDSMLEYNPKTGHNLIRFYGAISGGLVGYEDIKKFKGNKFSIENPNEHPLASFKDLLKPDSFGEDLDTITRFDDMKTPFEVARFIKQVIDKWSPPNDDNDLDDEPIKPMPATTPKLVGV